MRTVDGGEAGLDKGITRLVEVDDHALGAGKGAQHGGGVAVTSLFQRGAGVGTSFWAGSGSWPCWRPGG